MVEDFAKAEPVLAKTVLIIGIGNEYRGDDAAGIRVVRLIRARALPLPVAELSDEGTALMDLWRRSNAQVVFVIDAMISGAAPGCVRRFEAHANPLPTHFGANSSHLFGVASAVELARVLGYLPPQVIVYGIEAKSFDYAADLSPEIEAATRMVAERIYMECQMLAEAAEQSAVPAVTVLRSLFLNGGQEADA